MVVAQELKPAKPYPEFPLFPHQNGTWCKKIRGRMRYFGPWRDPDAALKKYLAQKDDLHAGREPRVCSSGLTVKRLCDAFYHAKVQKCESGELHGRTVRDYFQTCKRIVSVFGRDRAVIDLNPDDFMTLRKDISKTCGLVSLGNEIQRCRCVMRFAFDQGYIDRPVRYGQSFSKPSKRLIRVERATRGERMFEASEIRTILDGATQPMKSMALLAINGGLGQSDLAGMQMSDIELDSGWIDSPRQKTGIGRRIPLWTETVESVRAWIGKQQADGLCAEDDDLLFVTKYGKQWVRTTALNGPIDSIGREFAKVLVAKGLKRERLGFYALRHTFRTIADETKDFPAVNYVMGHADGTMGAVYRERIDDSRLLSVVEHVRKWLFGTGEVGGT